MMNNVITKIPADEIARFVIIPMIRSIIWRYTTMFERISANPMVCGGKPCIKGTRIPVTMVLELIEDGLTFDDILQNHYPSLTVEDIRACIEYARSLIQDQEIYFAEEVAVA